MEQFGPLAAPATSADEQTIHHPAELQLNDQEQAVLQAIQPEPTDIDQIVAVTQLPVHRVLSTISVLEMRRLIRRVSGSSHRLSWMP